MRTKTFAWVAGAALAVAIGSMPADAAIKATETAVASFDQVGTAPAVQAAFDAKKPVDYSRIDYQLTTPQLPTVPVPAALPLLATALAGLAYVRRRANKQA